MVNKESSSSSERKTKGGGFPSVNLEEALELIKKGSSAGWEMSKETFAGAIGSSSNSGPFLAKLAALRDFGLIERGDRIRFTALAKELIAPISDDPQRQAEDLQRAFLNCGAFKAIYEKIRDTSGTSNLDAIANIGVHDFRVSLKRKTLFAKNLAASAIFANLMNGEGNQLSIVRSEKVLNDNQESSLQHHGGVRGIKGAFQFKDVGQNWELIVSTNRPLNVKAREKIFELINELEATYGTSDEQTSEIKKS